MNGCVLRSAAVAFVGLALGGVVPWGTAWSAARQGEAMAPSTQPAASAPAPAASSAGGVARARVPLAWRLDIIAPRDVTEVLRAYLDLARFETEKDKSQAESATLPAPSEAASAAGVANAPPTNITRGELRRLVSAAPEQARELLQTLGYFSATIKTAVVDGTPTVVRLTIDPGPRSRVVDSHIEFEGQLDALAERGDKTAVALRESLRREWLMPPGQVFSQAAWTNAKNATLAQLRAQGYPLAQWSGTSAHVDPEQHQVHLFLVMDSGPPFYFGPISIEGLTRQNPQTIRNLLAFKTGEPYSEQKLLDTQEALQKAGLYESAYVTIDNDPAHAQAAPVLIKVHELAIQQATVGVGVSANTGPRVSLEHVHRRVFNTDWQAKSLLQLGRDESIAQVDLTSHPLPHGHRNLISAAATRLNADGTQTTSHRLRVGRTQDTPRIERTYYVEYQQATVRDSSSRTDASALFFNYQWVWRALDNLLLPTKGFAAQLETGAGQSFATTQANGVFSRLYAKGLFYAPLPGQWYASTRLEGAEVFAKGSTGIPDPLLFRAGGDNSVRGYAYRDLGPVRGGINVGGLVLGTASVELAHPLSARYPNWWGAVFADVGDAANSLTALTPHWGYGTGLRWRSPVGPLRLDLAYGQSVHRFRLHFSVGIEL